MNALTALRLACMAVTATATLGAQADSFTSSASSAGSASSGSVSGSLRGSSKSSTGGDNTAAVDYRVVDIAVVDADPDLARAITNTRITRLTLEADDPQQRLVLDLPQAIAEQQKLVRGDRVQARQRVYGFEFARGAGGDAREAFFLVLADDWYGDLAARPLSL